MNFDDEGNHDQSNDITSFLHKEFAQPMNIITYLKGKKTYLLALALFAYAIGGYSTGHLSGQEAIKLIYESGIASSIRAAIAKS
jgi:hypothetical protein